jgi:hypothetical protein
MLTFSVLWVALAAAITLIAMVRRTLSPAEEKAPAKSNESADFLTYLAVVSCLVLLAGFLCVGKFLVAAL